MQIGMNEHDAVTPQFTLLSEALSPHTAGQESVPPVSPDPNPLATPPDRGGTDASLPPLEVGATRRKLQPQVTPTPTPANSGSGRLCPPNRPLRSPHANALPVKYRHPRQPAPRVSRLGNTLKLGLTIVSLSAAIGLIGGGIWLGIGLMINPDQADWLNRWLPEWTRIPIDQQHPPQTIADIQTEIRQVGLIPGDLIPLSLQQSATNPTPTTAWLLPIYSPTPCPQSLATIRSTCDALVEVRVYQTEPAALPTSSASAHPSQYRRIQQLMVAGPAESFVLAALLPPASAPDTAPPGSNQPLPLMDLRRFEGTLPGIWFNLSGQRVQNTQTLLYGQVLFYNPEQLHLSLLAPWVSPANQPPTWQEVTGGGYPELVVNQTLDLEPKLVVYQLSRRNFLLSPWELAPIPLTPSALSDAAYQQALKLAQVGLWSPALQHLEAVKARGTPWSDLAQAQMDVIKLHARITALQAEQTWVSASEQVLTNLLDGRWQAALTIFDQSATKRLAIANLLQMDSGRLWRRLETALAIAPDEVALQTWGALFIQAQRGYEGAIAWLQQQRPMDATRAASIRQRLDLLQAAEAEQALPSHFSQIIGSVTPIATPDPADWLRPDTVPHLDSPADQQWYRIRVLGFHDGRQWQQPPFPDLDLSPTTATQQLWRLLGLNVDDHVQVVTWEANGQQQVTQSQVKAVRFQPGILELLTLGPALPPVPADAAPPLALSGTATRLLLQPPTLRLATLQQQDASHSEKIFTALWRDLQQAGQIPAGVNPRLTDWLPWIGHWLVQQVSLTDRDKTDLVFTLGAEELAMLKALATQTQPQPAPNPTRRTVILSHAGHLIYSEFTATPNQRLTAIVALNPQETAYLLVSDRAATAATSGYRLQHWSPSQQGFR